MSWYGSYNQSTKQLDSLLETRPSLATLLLSSDFIQQLKSFNPKLLDYVTNSQNLPVEMATYISVPPSQSDSVDRKYKLPLLTVQMIQTETICVINALLKQNGDQGNYFLSMFEMLKSKQILPLLAGYFNRVNFALCRSKYKQALQSVFTSTQYLELLINHSQNEAIANCLPLYLCVESGKNIVLSQQKIAIKMGIVRTILNRIDSQKNLQDYRSICLIENLCLVIRQIVQKYYLISNGKQMLEIILQQKYVQMVIGIMIGQGENSIPAMYLSLSYLKYYSLSAYNSDEGTEELARKNMERLQSQPFIKLMVNNFKSLLEKIKRQKPLTLNGYILLEVLCHCITLSSMKIFNVVKQAELFPVLIDLIFKNQNCNILHKLAERAILHVFSTEKKIYQFYKQYLFCGISIIDLTAKRLLQIFPEADGLEKAKSKGYFGILMKIIKIYSSISTTNVPIRDAITAKSQIWNKITKKIIKPNQANCSKQIGQLENIPDNAPIEFTVKKIENQLMVRLIQNQQILQQIKEEESAMTKTLQLNQIKKQGPTLLQTKIDDDSFFKSPLQDSIHRKKPVTFDTLNQGTATTNATQQANKNEEDKKPGSFNQFLSKRKVEVGQEIKMQRTQSGEKRLSADKKARLTSPSPKKRNSWKEQSQEDKPQKEQIKAPAVNKIPTHLAPSGGSQIVKNNLTRSTVEQNRRPAFEEESKRMMSLSTANLQSLKRTTIIRTTQQPKEKKYRKAKSKDKALFAYLGINIV